jgi:hypothetical protein
MSREWRSEGENRAEWAAMTILVTAIFQSDPRIRYCAVIDEEGREIAGGMRPGIESLEPEPETSRLRVQSVIGEAMAGTWDRLHGKADYVIVHRAKITVILFILSGSKSVLISAEPDFPLVRFPELAKIVEAFSARER